MKSIDAPSFLYIIGYGNMMKVGISDNPVTRLATLQTGVPEELSIYYACVMPRRSLVLKAEASIHRKLAARRVRGEWFRIDADDAADAATKVIRRIARGRGKAKPEQVYPSIDAMAAALGID